MAATIANEPLLLLATPSAAAAARSSSCKLLSFSLSIAAVISLTALITLHFSTTTTTVDIHLSTPSLLCATSPNPSTCRAIVANALTSTTTTRAQVLHRILSKSINHVAAVAHDIRLRTSDPRQQAALSDCAQLMDLSRDRLLSSASAIAAGSHDDAQTWLSAVLTNYDTCLDGQITQDVAAHVDYLIAIASASLAILSSISPPTNDEIAKLVISYPSWVTLKDRKLLEAPSSVNAIQANAVVAADGTGQFRTVQAAVDAAPSKAANRYVIFVKKGTYKENVNVGKQKKNIMIVGDGMDATAITGNLNVVDGSTSFNSATLGNTVGDGMDATIITGSLNVIDGSTTFNSATLAAVGDGFILQDICIQNTAGPEKHQAVALRLGADQSVVNRCRLEAYQDTLYAHSLRQFYRDSTVSGTVDFIFGNAAVVFQYCSLVARKPMGNQQNLVTAQGRTDTNQNTGTSIQNCQVVPSPDLVPVKALIASYLGRPWKEFSRTVFMQSCIDNHIVPKGWLEWNGTFALQTLYYGEYLNRGPGAGTAGRVTWAGYHVITSASEAMAFTVAQLIQGGSWLQSTGVAFTEGL